MKPDLAQLLAELLLLEGVRAMPALQLMARHGVDVRAVGERAAALMQVRWETAPKEAPAGHAATPCGR